MGSRSSTPLTSFTFCSAVLSATASIQPIRSARPKGTSTRAPGAACGHSSSGTR